MSATENNYSSETSNAKSCGKKATELKISVERFIDHPIIYPLLDDSIGLNIQGPSLIKVPSWIQNPLGKYYLYFADHKGSYIRLAYADKLEGPWTVHKDGSLHLSQTTFLHENPTLTKEQIDLLPTLPEKLGFDPNTKVPHNLMVDAVTAHIASPSAYIDNENKRIIMYVHGLVSPAIQKTRVSTSFDGINFVQESSEDLGKTYMRVFKYNDMYYALSMPGQFYRSNNPFTGFEEGNVISDFNTRHCDVLLKGDTLYVIYSVVGDAPEQFYLVSVDLSKPFEEWTASERVFVMKPERDWEGANASVEPSIRSTAYGHVNQLRDPFIYEEDGQLYLLYAVAGESGIGIAKLNVSVK